MAAAIRARSIPANPEERLQMTTLLEEESTIVVEIPSLQVHCPRCCNGRTQVRPGAKSYSDRVPCHLCRPAAHAAAVAVAAQS